MKMVGGGRMPLSLLAFMAGIMVVGGCSEKAKRDGRFDDDTVVAIVGSTSITYGQMKFKHNNIPELRKAQELESSRNPEEFKRMRERDERSRLRDRVFRVITENAMKEYGVTVTEDEVQERARETMERQLADNPGIAISYEKAVKVSRLMCMWVEDKEEAEVAYRKEFAETIDKAEWERMKARLEAGLKPHKLTMEDLEEGNRRAHIHTARAYCSIRQLVAKLVELGELEQGQGIDTWRWRQLSTIQFPVEELRISPDEKDTFDRWSTKR